jgi:hypothetical protein
MRIYNASLIEAMCVSIEECARRLFSQQIPQTLYHYTDIEGAKGIIQSNALWGTCLANQRKDASELQDAIQVIREEIDTVVNKGLPPLSKAIFESISVVLDSRRKWSFITCFCGDEYSQHHWCKHGKYRFGISSSQLLNLRCGDYKATHWLQPVIYHRETLRHAIRDCFEQIVAAQTQYITGDYGGPWMPAMSPPRTRDLAQLLLRVAASFKNEVFANDKEWRLFFCPNLAIGSTAPNMADEDFEPCIKTDKVMHVELRLRQPFEFFLPPRPPVQLIKSVCQSPLHNEETERETLNGLLRSYGAGVLCERTMPMDEKDQAALRS